MGRPLNYLQYAESSEMEFSESWIKSRFLEKKL
jgi:hypothetical protein